MLGEKPYNGKYILRNSAANIPYSVLRKGEALLS